MRFPKGENLAYFENNFFILSPYFLFYFCTQKFKALKIT